MTSRRPPPRALLALLAAVLLAGVTVPDASAAGGLSLSRGGPGTAWTAATVTTDGATVSSRLRLEDVALPMHLGARLYDRDLRLVSSSNLTLRSPEEGLLVQTEPSPGVGIAVDELEQKGDGRLRDVEGTFALNPSGASFVGRYTIVLWVATSDSRRWDWQLDGGPGASVLASSSGPQVFLATSRDFSSGLVNAAGGAYAAASSVQARAQVASSFRRTQRATFVGSFYPVLSSADTLSVVTPTGTRQCVPDCQFDAVVGSESAPRGEYEFRLSGVGAGGAGGQNAGDVIVSGAEVALPGLG